MNEYPHMLYKDGAVGEDWRIVADAAEETVAAEAGYLRAGESPKRARKGKAD